MNAPRSPKIPDSFSIEVGLGQLGEDPSQDETQLLGLIAKKFSCQVEELPELQLKKTSLDARGRNIRFHYLYEKLDLEEQGALGGDELREVDQQKRVLIVGDGPCGLFCAYELARRGIGCVVVDRGKMVQPRRRDLKGLNKRGIIDGDSNYCFGEGGAGTYSDGKLYTRAHKRGDIRDILEILHIHGAHERILTDARPHIGSNQLPNVVSNLREALENVGVEFRFECKLTDLESLDEKTIRCTFADGSSEEFQSVVLATGHSARDIYRLLERRQVLLEAKGFALGVRIEHPQPLINEIQYGASAGHCRLPAAAYRLAHTDDRGGVFSFCMCPGGFIVPASTEPETLVVNGMSLSRRDSPFANSGFVAGIEVAELEQIGLGGPLGGIEFQSRIEKAAYAAGSPMLEAPATRIPDFLAGKFSSDVPKSSYIPGLVPADISGVINAGGLDIADRLRKALRIFETRMRGYISYEGVLVGTESRTSAPVRIPRDPDTFQSPSMSRLFPAGEGAGYAGGIVSAAMDGIQVARKITSVISAGAAMRIGGPQ